MAIASAVDVGGQLSLEAGFALDVVAVQGDAVVAAIQLAQSDLYEGTTSFPIDVDEVRLPQIITIDLATNTPIGQADISDEVYCSSPYVVTESHVWGAGILGEPCIVSPAQNAAATIWNEEWIKIGFGPFPTPTSGRVVAVVGWS